MDIRTHKDQEKASEVAYSNCGAYRYWLSRRWAAKGQTVNFVMLNPSKADEIKNDPTVERCERRARQMGYGAVCVTNLFAWRETHPSLLRRARRPVGPRNDAVLLEQAISADCVIVAWGTHGALLERGPLIAKTFHKHGVDMHHFGLTKDGHPRHPLYVPYSAKPQLWNVQSD